VNVVKPVTRLLRRLTPGRPDAGGKGIWRARVTLAGVVAVCMTLTVVAVSGAGADMSGMKFFQSGHMIYNSTLRTVFHIDGGTKQVDGQVPVPGAGPGSRVVQTDKSGYVLADGSIIEFGKSDLKVTDPLPVPSGEQAVGLESAGAAFAVFRRAGQISRLGDHPAVVSMGGPLGQPVVTSTGTVWVHGLTTGRLCQLPVQADRLSCTATLPSGHVGSLTLVGDQPVFVDITEKKLRAVSAEGFGRVTPLAGVDLSPASIVAANDVDGRVPIVDPRNGVLQLVDPSALTSAKPADKPITRKLPTGRYDQIASSGQGLALINSADNTLVTLDRVGGQQTSRKIPPPSKQAKLKEGERPGLVRGADSRLYLDGVAGERAMVVDSNGQVTEVEATGPATKPTPSPSQKPSTPLPPKPTSSLPPVIQPADPPTRRPVEPVLPPVSRTTEPRRTTKPPERTEPPPPVPKPTVRASRPGAPGNVKAAVASGAVSVTWSAAQANGAPITSYVVSWAGGSRKLAGSARKVSVTGLAAGQSYTFTVRAANRVGAGPGVSSSRVTLGAPAEAPGGLRAVGSSGAVTLTWSRPNLNGGTFLRYGITQNGDPENSSATTYRWTGLTNGKRYTFQVRAVTTGPDGRLLIGKPATVTATAGASGSAGNISISKGAAYDDDSEVCEPGKCNYIDIHATGLQPNTVYMFQGYTTNYGALHKEGPEPLKANAQGVVDVSKFYNDDTTGKVWVTATGPGGPYESKHIDW
jgi:hypothetical protein